MRSTSPGRNIRSSSQNLAAFDSNLDHLLEDLQNSVSRPGSSSTNYKDITKTNSLNRISDVKSSNPVTEYSSDDAYNYTSPDGTRKVSCLKKENYVKTTSQVPTERRMQNSINQLDSLLDDLQQVKKSSFLDTDSFNKTGLDPDFHSNKSVHRELHYGDTPKSRTQSLDRQSHNSVSRDYVYSSEGTYGDIRPLRTSSPASSSRTSTLSKQTKVKNVHSYPVEVIESTSADINPEVLAHLDPNLHPPGNTKVTTTIKTYTYEIPGSGDYKTNLDTSIDSEKYVATVNQSQSTPSKSFVYSKVDNRTENIDNYKQEPSWNYKEKEILVNDSKVTSYKPYQKPASPVGHSVIKQTTTTRNYQPGSTPEPTEKYFYNESITTKNVDTHPQPQKQEAFLYEEKRETKNVHYPPPKKETYIIKEIEDTTTTDTVYPPPSQPSKTIIYEHESHTTTRPREPVNIKYQYSSESRTTNNYSGFIPNEKEPLLPKPFQSDKIDGPPKRVDELMASMGPEPPNGPYNAGYNAHEIEIFQQKKVETIKQQYEPEVEKKKEPVQKSKNVSGPPVYYPPGEMFAKKEESAAAWRADGAYAKGSEKYQYEAESKSKSKGGSGAAIVPVCLPLCCGLPCTIL